MKKALALVFCALSIGSAYSQTGVTSDSVRLSYAKRISAEDVKKHVFTLASDEYVGRYTGEKGQKKAAEYIQNHFKEFGLVGPVKTGDNPYEQGFELYKLDWGEVFVKSSKKAYGGYEDFAFFSLPELNEKTDVDCVFAGTEEDALADELDLKGKVVFVVTDKDNPREVRTVTRALNKKGVKLLVVVGSENDELTDSMISRYRKSIMDHPRLSFKKPKPKEPGKDMGIAFARKNMLLDVFGLSEKSLEKLMAKKERKRRKMLAKIKGHVSVKFARTIEPVQTENVLGYLEGTDKKDELLVISAHYDHIGVQDGEVYNGADDNATGTTAILELADAFAKAKKDGHGPRRSVLFISLTAEEVGLLGSKYYVSDPVFPLENTVVDLNIDMIGRRDSRYENDPNYVYLIGSDKLSKDLHNLSEKVNQRFGDLKLDYKYNDEKDPNRYYYRSDHYNFAKNDIPVIFYFNGTHADYHRASDTPDKIECDKVAKITRLVFQTAWEIANREERLKLDADSAQ
ncbi:hypothetical protein FUAX_16910 [Fulvitalea axinellae]|uniref:Peptidase M28 domain-containing protein n=1 Tax=Fulvitalea axinellae TaxID=1182444 RepID=A0AAU9D474_9BACT|nr:hypothetical protein FUAX_16910 [Fulvitalea axinellae]